MRNVSSYDMAALCTHGILTLSSVLELAYLGYFSAMIERRVNAERPTIFSRFNMTIFSLSLSLISFHAATAVNVYERPYLFEFPIARTVTGLSLCIYELMYVWYTWLRSKVILKLKGGFRYNVAVAVVAIAPGISAVQFVALCFHLYSSDELKPAAMVASNVTTAVSGMAIIAFDCIMLYTFVRFLRENQIESDNIPANVSIGVTKRFSIIATYGKWSCVALLGALLIYISMSVVGYQNAFANLLLAFCHAMIHVSFSLLLLMKVALNACDVKEEQPDYAARNPSGAKNDSMAGCVRDVKLTVMTNRDIKSVSTMRTSEGNARSMARASIRWPQL